MPFVNLSADPENEFFSDGLAEELLNVLARNPGLKVTGRTSSFAFKGRQEDLRVIGKQLGVEHVLEGSVRKAGNRVRITVQLVGTDDGFHVWSETYDRVLEDIFAVQDEIAGAVATALDVTLLRRPSAAPVANAEGYTLALRAKRALSQWTESSSHVAEKLYRQAVDLDGNDARAWAGLARTHVLQAAYGFADVRDSARRATDAATRALALDDRLAEAHEVRGLVHAAFEHQLDLADASFRRAHALAPGDSQMVSSMALVRLFRGSFDEAIRLAVQATELDPLNPEAHMNLGRAYYAAGRLEEAGSTLRHALELSPEMASVSAMIAMVLADQGRLDEALETVNREPRGGFRATALAIIHEQRGDRAASDRALDELRAEGPQWAVQLAMVHATRRENDTAFEWLERAIAESDAGAPLIGVNPQLRNLRSDPRWPELLSKIGL
jgi:TolB-like protein/Tfp pilus assembly protein PilF